MTSKLDELLTLPLGKKPKPKKKKSRKQQSDELNEARLREIELAAERARKWRLSAEPYETRIFVQRTYCANCCHVDEATISPPLVAYRDRIGRVYTQRADIVPTHLPITFNYSTIRVGACHHCAAMCCQGARPEGFQLQFNFSKERKPSTGKALVPVAQTPQAMMWIVWALMAEPLSYEATAHAETTV